MQALEFYKLLRSLFGRCVRNIEDRKIMVLVNVSDKIRKFNLEQITKYDTWKLYWNKIRTAKQPTLE
ncbi:hypothetical protein VNO77_42703 [Canavalia gladiata]|uniref:Uncharacterized protein n=1 Tax=Canavalia gladiata TaxID=3824 RepID=A0AAN9JV09_CANGL